MPRIRVLPDALVNRIAAGEVVERPASVVRELLDNSLDAGAGRVEIELATGGRTLVRVSDDGGGMDGDDSLLALERHATSKIDSVDDLTHLQTLGFRGEALPSIAAVSRFELLSCADPAEGGVRVTVEGGRVLAVEPAARPRGTTVEVRDLFFNTPARRKFLHAPETELKAAQEVVWGLALARPDVAFILRHGGRTLLELLPAADAAARFADLLQKRGGDRVVRGEAAAGGVVVTVLLAAGSGSGRPSLLLLVNRRPVKDRLLVGAAMRALREGAATGGSRLAVLVELASEEVDVNVHPAKAEVRFARAGAVFSAVARAVGEALARSHGRVDVRRIEVGSAPGARVAESAQAPYRGGGLFPHPVYDRDGWVPSAAAGSPSSGALPSPPTAGSGARAGSPDTPFGRLLGQYRSSFLLLEDDLGLVIVDQHVAHERVLYDRIRRRLAGAAAPAQRLLDGVLVDLDPVLVAALPRVAPLLDRVGLEAEAFGQDVVRVTALPPELGADAVGGLLAELLERATALDGVPERIAEALEEELAAALSCRAAIKVNHPLEPAAQRALLADLAVTDDPYRCPHGRPIVLRLSQDEMERRLGRR